MHIVALALCILKIFIFLLVKKQILSRFLPLS